MAKKVYIGVSNYAQDCKKIYIGVNGIARKVLKGYIGVDGVAQHFFSSAPVIVFDSTYGDDVYNYIVNGTYTLDYINPT